MSTEERAEVAPAAEQFKNIFGSRSKKPLSVKGSEIGLEFTPAGTVFGLNDIRNELKKENPDYYLIGLMGGAEIIGLIPGLDKAAIDAIRAGAKRITGSKKIDQTLEAFEKPDPKKVVEQKILAGPGAKDYSNRSLHKAQQLKAEGYSPKKIEEITGRVQVGSSEDYIPNELIKNPQAPFKFEIPDKGIIIKKNDGYITLREASKQRPIRVGNLIPTHTKLFEQYPDLKNTAFYIDPKLGRGAHFDSTDGTYGSIVIGPDHPGISKIIEEGNVNNPEFRRVFFHELQHAAQARDFHYTALRQLGGGSETYTKAVSGRDPFGEDFTKAAIAKNPKLAELRDKMVKLFKEDTRGLDSTSKVSYGSFGQEVTQVYNNPETAKKMAELMKELDYESYKTYLQTASEVEAATVGARAKPTFAKDQPLVSSEVSKRKDVETYDDYARGYSDSKINKLIKRMTTRKADLTKKEIGDLAGRGVNFVRYALEIDDELVGFSEGGLATQMNKLFDAEGRRRRKDRPVVEEYVHPLTTVPFFDRPLGASTRDQIKFIDEDGNAHFESALGYTYTIKLNPDQRNLRAKIQEDFIPAAKEYLKDPKMPTKEQAVGFGKAVLEGVIDTASIPGDVLTGKKSAAEITNMDILDLATLTSVGASTFNVPKDSLRMASVSGMFGKKKTPVEEYLEPVKVDTSLLPKELVDSIMSDSDTLANEQFLRNTSENVINQPIEPLKFDTELGERPVGLLDYRLSKIDSNNALKNSVANRIIGDVFYTFKTRHGVRLPSGKLRDNTYSEEAKALQWAGSIPANTDLKNKVLEIDDPALLVKQYRLQYKAEEEDFIKKTTDMVTDQVTNQFNSFLKYNPGLVLKLAAAKELVKKYKESYDVLFDEDMDYTHEEMIALSETPEELRAAFDMEFNTQREILDKFFREDAVGYVPDPNKIFTTTEFKIKEVDVGPDGAQRMIDAEPVSVDFTGGVATGEYDVYDFDTVFGDDALENSFREGLGAVLTDEWDNTISINPDTKITRTVDSDFPEASFQEIVDSYDKNLTSAYTFRDTATGQFENLGVEIIQDLIKEKIESNKEFVLGSEVFKRLSKDPRMNVKNIPKFMDSPVFKNQKLMVAKDFRYGDNKNPNDLVIGNKSLIDEFRADSYEVKGSALEEPKYSGLQLQGDIGFEGGIKDYTYEVPTIATKSDGTKSFRPKKRHYDPKALSHIRFSVYTPGSGLRIGNQNVGEFDRLTDDGKFIMQEESQTDLLSGGYEKFKKIDYKKEDVKKIIEGSIVKDVVDMDLIEYDDNFLTLKEQGLSDKEIKDTVLGIPEAGSSIISSLTDDITEDIINFYDKLDNQRVLAFRPEPQAEYAKLMDKYSELIEKQAPSKNKEYFGKTSYSDDTTTLIEQDAKQNLKIILGYVKRPTAFSNAYEYLLDKDIGKQRTINLQARREPQNYQDPPIKNNIEAVELNLQTLIYHADSLDIDKIVIPNFEMVAAQRFGGIELDAAIKNQSLKKDANRQIMYDNDGKAIRIEGNALYRNYVTDFNKALNRFKEAYPEMKTYVGVELPYGRRSKTDGLAKHGTVIDISEMRKIYDLSKPKFSGGGLVRE